MEKLQPGAELVVGSHSASIVKYLSEGGFSQIYQVKIDPSEDESDIACLKRVIVQDKNGLTQLRKEVDVMKVLSKGRNIVKYYDSHAERLENGKYQVFVLMELCSNKSLLDYMNAKIKTMLSEEVVLKIMYDISLGIYEMHKLKLVHRDIKIENVLIDSAHNFKLCDFGSTSSPISPPKDQREYQILSHDILYQTTPQYRAPEMIDLYRGFPIDEKADIWALGCFLYKLCYYITPFEKNGDIAILHASFQFPPAPVFSGDIKNLIIIMLQENPLFRPNIVQVIMILTKLMNVSARVTDFYNLGAYNFQALHDYQRQKQNEILQQQYYYQQQQQKQQQQQQHQQQLHHQQQRQQQQPPQQQLPQQSLIDNTMSSHNHTKNPMAYSSSEYGGSSTSLNEAQIQNSDSNSLTKRHSIKSHNSSLTGTSERRKSTVSLDANKIEQPGNILGNFEQQDEGNNSDELSFSELDHLENVEQRFPSLDDLLEPTVGGNEYRDTPLDRQGSLDNDQDIVTKRAQQNPSSFEKKGISEYEKKETWERSQREIDSEAQKLADDIFSKSPTNIVPIRPTKTNQSAVSDVSSKREYDAIRRQSGEEAFSGSSEDKLNITHYSVGDDKVGEKETKLSKDRDHGEDNENIIDISTGVDDNDGESSFPTEMYSIPVSSTKPKSKKDQKPTISKTVEHSNVSEKKPVIESPIIGPTTGNNPFPLNDQFAAHVDTNEKKSANPWGEFRPSVPSNNKSSKTTTQPKVDLFQTPGEPSTLMIEDQLVSLTLNEGNSKRDAFVIEPNLIDLEVGLESSDSSIATPTLKPKPRHDLGSQASLLNLEDGTERGKSYQGVEGGGSMPHYKKRLSSMQLSSNISFQEEVIDFASDDENPANGSKMNRLSIRNKLKKPKSRKSSEHKKSDSGGEKKRLSFFGT